MRGYLRRHKRYFFPGRMIEFMHVLQSTSMSVNSYPILSD